MKKKQSTRLTDRKHESILDAAIKEFRTSGFDNTSMNRIAEVANVSKRTVYNHFEGKDDLFAAIVERLKARCDRLNDFTYDPAKCVEQQLREIAKSHVEMASSEEMSDLARVIMPRFLQTPELAQQLLGNKELRAQGLTNWIEAAKRAGHLKVANCRQAAQQFHGIIDAFAFWPQILGGEPPLTKKRQKEIIDSTVKLFLDVYAKLG